MLARRFIVRGRVQGVGFRWFVEREARNIGFLYSRRRMVDDPHSLLRPPMHGAGDIDKLEEKL